MKVEKFRDLTLIDLNEKQTMVIACDSVGGIGDKEFDEVIVDPEISGYFGAVVPLMEVIAYGAKPITIANNLCVEMNPTGNKILKGVKKATKDLDLEEDYITGTSEENMETRTTGFGITVVGIIDKNTWVKPKSKVGSILVAIGIPKVGNEVVEDEERSIMNTRRMINLRNKKYISEILPVGSKGIKYEIGEICRTNGLDIELESKIEVDLYKTAGPATCCIASLDSSYLDRLKEDIDIPVNILGRFIEKL